MFVSAPGISQSGLESSIMLADNNLILFKLILINKFTTCDKKTFEKGHLQLTTATAKSKKSENISVF